jgi:pSer/pThr/pTyr-binding forkhead associated (FHA) protein
LNVIFRGISCKVLKVMSSTDPRKSTVQLSDSALAYLNKFQINPSRVRTLSGVLPPGQPVPTRNAFLIHLGGKSVRISKSVFAIGSEPGNDLLVESDHVSRRNALINRDQNGDFWLSDLSSTNGTFVNHQPLTGKILLRNRDRIHIADQEYVFDLPGMPVPHGDVSDLMNQVKTE